MRSFLDMAVIFVVFVVVVADILNGGGGGRGVQAFSAIKPLPLCFSTWCWSSSLSSSSSCLFRLPPRSRIPHRVRPRPFYGDELPVTAKDNDDNDENDNDDKNDNDKDEGQTATAMAMSTLTDEDWSVVDAILTGYPDSVPMEDRVASTLGGMHPRLVMALRNAAGSSSSSSFADADKEEKLRTVGMAMSSLLDGRLGQGKDLLASMLRSGEIRKLDGLIGRAAKEGKLDMAFFTVLNMNLRDASYGSGEKSDDASDPAATAAVVVPTNDNSGTAGRLQILQHIYTRCQEEIEKAVPPGAGLLNKLLRTEVASIRSNQLRHYLAPQSSTIQTPEGKEIKLEGTGKALVSLQEFIDAIGNAVRQIRTVEKADGTSREAAADLVESVRQIAIEGRVAIAEIYGVDSTELRKFEDGLQPVFRPGTSGSEYIQGT